MAGAMLCVFSVAWQSNAALGADVKPTVKGFRASVKSLPSAGGKVTLSASVTGGSHCAVTSTPSLRGLPAKVKCSKGLVTRTVHLPAFAAGRTYKFGFSVTGPGGTAAAKAVTVIVREALPTITAISVAPADLPSAGGTVTVSAKVNRAASCTVSVTPASAGVAPVSQACFAGGAQRISVAIPVTLPALTGSVKQALSLTLKVTGPGGSASASTSASVWPAMQFSAPVPVDTPAGWLGAVSCVSSTFCMGIDLASGAAAVWNGTSWSAPYRLESGPYLDDGYQINVSCVATATTPFCLAVDDNGNSWAYQQGSWSSTGYAGLPVINNLSCGSSVFCVATNVDEAVTFNGASWSLPVLVSTDDLQSISCSTATSCLAVGSSGLAYSYTQAGWSAGAPFDSDSEPVQVSCASPTLCAAIDLGGNAFLYTGTWSAAANLSARRMDSVSCPIGSSFCMALSKGTYYTTGGTTWSSGGAVDPGTTSILSCASSTYCMATEGSSLYLFTGTSWAKSVAPNGPVHGFTYSISCPTRTFCMAVDWTGAYLIYNGSTWSAPQTISPLAVAVDSVSCTSPTFCMAVDANITSNVLGGHVFTFNGQSWTYLGQADFPLTSVSCASQFSCMMLSTADGSVFSTTWNGTSTWDNRTVDSYVGFGPDPGNGFVSCVTANFCVAVDQLGNAFTFNGVTWSGPTALDPGWAAAMDAVSCPTTTFCAATDAGGDVYTFNGTTWTAPDPIDSTGQPQTVSCTVSDLVGGLQRGPGA
jgi:hypothetical protein